MKFIFIQPKGLGLLQQPTLRKKVKLESRKSSTSPKIWENHSNLFKIISTISNGDILKQLRRMRKLLTITSNLLRLKTTSSQEFSTLTRTPRPSELSHTIPRSIFTNLISSTSNKKCSPEEITSTFLSNLCMSLRPFRKPTSKFG
jgi:hypothetical protein